MSKPFPLSFNLDRSVISVIAHEFVKAHEMPSVKNIVDIVSVLGGEIKKRDFLCGNHNEASLVIQKQGQFTIYIPVLGDLYSSFWNICHELGHYVLHYLYAEYPKHETPLIAYRIDAPEADKEADMFATLLIDLYKLHPVAARLDNKIINMDYAQKGVPQETH